MAEKDDGLGLSLSLRCPEKLPPFPLNLMPFMHHNKPSLNDAFQTPSERNNEMRSSFLGIDVNRPATMTDCDEEVAVSSPNSTVSSLSGKRSEREENEAERASSSFEDDDGGGGEAGKKKLRLSKEQAAALEETFKEHNTLNPKQKVALAKQLNLRPRQVEVWFQNRRARTKLKQTEVDCEYLKRCCETLTEENRRLQKEVNELRTLKHSPQFYMNMNPPTTLTMCPSCERVAAVSSSSSSSSSAAVTSLALATTGSAIARLQSPVGPNHQRPIATNPWAAMIIPNHQPYDAHRPLS